MTFRNRLDLHEKRGTRQGIRALTHANYRGSHGTAMTTATDIDIQDIDTLTLSDLNRYVDEKRLG